MIAVLSTLWYTVEGGVSGLIQDSGNVSWTWPLLWDSMVTFPWIPALYTGVFSTGLCLWGEVIIYNLVTQLSFIYIYMYIS